MKRLLILLVKGYQATLSRVLRPTCRFVPTCSEYMIECLEKRGVLRGLLKGTGRLLRCNPFFRGGYDPVE